MERSEIRERSKSFNADPGFHPGYEEKDERK